MTDFTEIPILDLSPLVRNDQTAISSLASEFARVFGDIGFGYISDHGIDQELIDSVFIATRAFHALPLEEKLAIKLDERHRGFIPINTSTDVTSRFGTVTKPNQSESFMMMREDGKGSGEIEAGTFLAGSNQWPQLEGFRERVSSYHDAMVALGRRLVQLASLAIGAGPQDLLQYFNTPTTWLRLLHYPPIPAFSPDDLYGSAPHCDFGCLTILAQDEVGGLQVQTPDKRWIDVPYKTGTFVVNIGDMLNRWSNGKLRSTPHRVINVSGRERYSCPFFFDPHVNTTVRPLSSCVGPANPVAFEPILFADFLREQLQASYERHKN